MCEDQDEQYSSEDDSDDPKTGKRATITLNRIKKKKGRAKEVPPPGGTALIGNTTKVEANTDENPTTTKMSKTVTSVEITNTAANVEPQHPVTALMPPAFHIAAIPSIDETLELQLSAPTSALNSATTLHR